jgi:DNA-binding NarL/FixJ family response regulator
MTTNATYPNETAVRSSSSKAATVAIACSRPELLDALLASLAGTKDLTTIANPVTNPSALFSYLETWQPRILLVDRQILDRLGPRSTGTIHKSFPGLRVLLLCDDSNSMLVHEIARNRFRGFVLVSHASDTCVRAIRAVNQGELWMPRALLEKLIFEQLVWTDRDNPIVGFKEILTSRQVQAVGFVRKGFTNKQIAFRLGIQEDTVKKHLYSAYAKLGVHSRTELMALPAPV